MKKTNLVWALQLVLAAPLAANALNVQPDPQNPNGYVLLKSEVATAAQNKTANPMYAIWSNALRTAENSLVESIVPNGATNPVNVKRAERVFG